MERYVEAVVRVARIAVAAGIAHEIQHDAGLHRPLAKGLHTLGIRDRVELLAHFIYLNVRPRQRVLSPPGDASLPGR